jgi:predicted P-loop ATPase
MTAPKGYDLSDFLNENPGLNLEDITQDMWDALDAPTDDDHPDADAPTPPPPDTTDARRLALARMESHLLMTKPTKSKPAQIRKTMHNINTIFREHPDWAEALRYNRREMFIYITPKNPILPGLKRPQLIRDCDFSLAYMWIEKNYPMLNDEGKTRRALVAAAEVGAPYDPLLDYFGSLEWDGTPRLDKWLTTYAGAPDTEYTRAVASKYLISAVARTYRPGCKVDTMLILRGEQGTGKSTVLKELASEEFFTDHLSPMADKDARMELQGPLIIEIAELDSLKKSESSQAKAFITTTHDRFRAPYSAVITKVPRRCVFAASTNEDEFLKDSTGARRFWPVDAPLTDAPGIRRDRDQIWAEAIVRFHKGEQWWMDTAQEKLAKKVQTTHTVSDAWESRVVDYCMKPITDDDVKPKYTKMFYTPTSASWGGQAGGQASGLATRIYISSLEIMDYIGEAAQRDKYAKKRINDVFKKLGFQSFKERLRIDGCQVRLWGIPVEFFTENDLQTMDGDEHSSPDDWPGKY